MAYDNSLLLTWSSLSSKPVLLHFVDLNQYAVAWGTEIMSVKQARWLAADLFFDCTPTPGLKHVAMQEYVRLVMSGALGNKEFIPEYHTMYSNLKNYLIKYVGPAGRKTEATNLLDWFNPSIAYEIKGQHADFCRLRDIDEQSA